MGRSTPAPAFLVPARGQGYPARPVAERSDLVVIQADGAIRVLGRAAERRLRDRAGRYRLVADAKGLVVLRADEGPGELGAHPRVLLAGEIVSRMTVLEVVNMIAISGWRGEMHVFGPDHHRAMAIDHGAVKYARSDDPDDRLGQVLYQAGAVTKAQLDDVLAATDRERRLGTVLVDRGLLTQKQLFTHLQKQVEQIFFAALLTGEGSFVFLRPDVDEPPPDHPVHLPVQALLLEGVQRIDEMALFRGRIPSSDFVPALVPRASIPAIDPSAQVVLAFCDGERDIDAIARESGLGEFLTTKTLYGLIQQGLVELHKKTGDGGAAVKRLTEQFNEVLREVFRRVAEFGGVEATRQTLEAWIQGSGYGPIFGEKVGEDGAVDPEFVAAAMANVEVENPMEGLLQALHELSTFALFAATSAMPRGQELALSRDVTERLKQIQL